MPPSNRYVRIVNGEIHPVEGYGKDNLSKLLPDALATEYTPLRDKTTNEILESEWDYRNPDGTWMTKAQVGALRQADNYSKGDKDAAYFLHDRILGKAKQQVEQLTMTGTLQDFLAMVAERDANPSRQIEIIIEEPEDAEPLAITENPPPLDDDDMSWL